MLFNKRKDYRKNINYCFNSFNLPLGCIVFKRVTFVATQDKKTKSGPVAKCVQFIKNNILYSLQFYICYLHGIYVYKNNTF